MVAAATAGSARAALFFLFKPAYAKPGERVTVRMGGTPESFIASQRQRPFGPPIRLYLVSNAVAPRVRSRLDARLHFIGTLVPDRRGHGILSFGVPPLGTGSYAVAAWCPGCARYSRGRTFSVLHVDENIVPRYRPLMLLRVEMPAATKTCPVTVPGGSAPPGERPSPGHHGNGALWTALPRDGLIAAERHGDGTLRNKFPWWAVGVAGKLSIRAQRLDAPAPPARGVSNSGWPETGFRGSAFWASIVLFPSEGCWRVNGRVRDISLSFVVEVVERRIAALPR